LDGPESFHNLVRTYYGVNKGTYKRVVDAIGNLRDYHVAVSSIYLTLTDATFNISPQTLIAWLADIECTEVTVEPDLVNSSQQSPLDMVERLMEYEWACRHAHITLHGFWKRPFLNLVGARQWGAATSFCGSLQGTNLVLTETGTISVCGYSAIRLGDIYHLDNLPALQDRWGAFVVGNQRGQIAACMDCPIEGVCMGGCYLTREFSGTTDAPIFQERCTIYLEATRHLLNDAVEHLAPA
jgi:radical SAM protein with 4Fe4S-binding SPASM domain